MMRITHKLFTSLLLGALLIAMVANSALAAGRAASHVGGAVRALPTCHHVATADTLAPLTANACDTLCAGSAPELTQDHPPGPDVVVTTSVRATPEIPVCLSRTAAPPPAHRHPPPIPPYQRDRRLLI